MPAKYVFARKFPAFLEWGFVFIKVTRERLKVVKSSNARPASRYAQEIQSSALTILGNASKMESSPSLKRVLDATESYALTASARTKTMESCAQELTTLHELRRTKKSPTTDLWALR